MCVSLSLISSLTLATTAAAAAAEGDIPSGVLTEMGRPLERIKHEEFKELVRSCAVIVCCAVNVGFILFRVLDCPFCHITDHFLQVSEGVYQYEREFKGLNVLLFPEILDHIAFEDRVRFVITCLLFLTASDACLQVSAVPKVDIALAVCGVI